MIIKKEKNVHIVFVTTELTSFNCCNFGGGLSTFTSNMAKIFTRQGHKVSIIWASTKDEKVEIDENIDLYSFCVPLAKWKKMNNIAGMLSNIVKEDKDSLRQAMVKVYKAVNINKMVRQINRKYPIDIIHYCNHVLVYKKGIRQIPYCVRISGFMNIWKGGANLPNGSIEYMDNPLSLKEKFDEYTVKKSKYVVAPSKLIAQISKKSFKKDVTVIESPFELNQENWDFSCFEKELQGKKYILHFGNLRYAKGTHIVAQLIEEFLQKYPDMYVVLAGRSEELKNKQGKSVKAHELVMDNAGKDRERVLYVGSIPREQLYPLIQNAELCLLPSRIENLSNACIEAMAMGKIVVATNGASYEQLIDDRVSGFLCERDNADSFLKGIEEALNMPEEKKNEMKKKIKRRTELLSPDRIYQQYFEYYQKVMSEWKV